MSNPIGQYSAVPTPRPIAHTPITPYGITHRYEQRDHNGSTPISALTYAKAKDTFFKGESVTDVGKAFDAILFSSPAIKAGKTIEAILFSAPVAAVGRVLNTIACYAFGVCEEEEGKTEQNFVKTGNFEHLEADNIDLDGINAVIVPLSTEKRDEEFSTPSWIYFVMSTSYQNNMNSTQMFTPCDSVQRHIIFRNANGNGNIRDTLNITLEFGPSCTSASRSCIDDNLGFVFNENRTLFKLPYETIDSDFWEYNVSTIYSSFSWRLTCQGDHKLLMTFLDDLKTGLDNVVACDNQAHKTHYIITLMSIASVVTVIGVGCCVWKYSREFKCDDDEFIDLQIQPEFIPEYNEIHEKNKLLTGTQQKNYQTIVQSTSL